mgnify:CR=1 FL=1
MKVYEILFTKIPKTICRIALIVCVILDLIGLGYSSLVEKIKVGEINAWYETLVGIFPNFDEIISSILPWLIMITFYLIPASVLKPIIIVFPHTSMPHTLEDIGRNVKKKYFIKSIPLNQPNVLEQSYPQTEDIKNVDNQADMLKSKATKYRCAYYGIAHTPLVFRLGFKYGNGRDIVLLHRKRGERDSKFEELSNDDNKLYINHSEINADILSSELIVSISTTAEINQQSLEILDKSSKHVIMFSTNEHNYDVILSYKTVKYLCNGIVDVVKDLVSKYNIKTIHMVISASVEFTFALGQEFNNNQFPHIIVYHFEAGEYQWGISMRDKPNKAFVPTRACNR